MLRNDKKRFMLIAVYLKIKRPVNKLKYEESFLQRLIVIQSPKIKGYQGNILILLLSWKYLGHNDDILFCKAIPPERSVIT